MKKPQSQGEPPPHRKPSARLIGISSKLPGADDEAVYVDVTDPRCQKYRPKGPPCLLIPPDSRQRYFPGPREALIGPDDPNFEIALRRDAEAGDRHARLILCVARVFGLS